MAGVHPVTFWLSNLTWDLMLLCCVCIVLSGTMYGLDERMILSSNGAAFAFFILNLMFGLGAILMAYVFSFATKSAPSAFTFFVIFSLVAGVIAPLAVFFLDMFRYACMHLGLFL